MFSWWWGSPHICIAITYVFVCSQMCFKYVVIHFIFITFSMLLQCFVFLLFYYYYFTCIYNARYATHDINFCNKSIYWQQKQKYMYCLVFVFKPQKKTILFLFLKCVFVWLRCNIMMYLYVVHFYLCPWWLNQQFLQYIINKFFSSI